MNKLPTEEYETALEKMKKSPPDRIGVLGKMGVIWLAVWAGIAAAGPIALFVGAATLFGSTFLATMLGKWIKTDISCWWYVGAGLAGGALGYVLSKLVLSGGTSDAVKGGYMEELRKTIASRKKEATDLDRHELSSDTMNQLIEAIKIKVADGSLPQDKATTLLKSVEQGTLSEIFALQTVQGLSRHCD